MSVRGMVFILIVTVCSLSIFADEQKHEKQIVSVNRGDFEAFVRFMKEKNWRPDKIWIENVNGNHLYRVIYVPFHGDIEEYYAYWFVADDKYNQSRLEYIEKGYIETWHQTLQSEDGRLLHHGVYTKSTIDERVDAVAKVNGDIKVYDTKGQFGTLRIKNFRYGLIAFDFNKDPYIYKLGTRFEYRVNGECTANHDVVPCQWRGFEFYYEAPDEITVLECITKSDQSQSFVTPSKIIAEYSLESRWKFILKGKSGYYIRPQYTSGLSVDSMRLINTCTNKGNEVLHWVTVLNK